MTDCPAQIVLLTALDVTVTEAGLFGVTAMVCKADVTVAGLAQVAFEVNLTETVSPLVSVEVVNVELVCPETALPFTNHWYCGLVPPFT